MPFRAPEELPESPGYFDRTQLQQALINLLKNAARLAARLRRSSSNRVVTVVSGCRCSMTARG